MLVIDEVHSLQAGTVREQARFLNMLRFLGNELRIPLVCVGTQAARNALRADGQLVRRFEAFALSPWRDDDEFAGLIGSLMRSLPLRRESVFGDLARQRLVEATGGAHGMIARGDRGICPLCANNPAIRRRDAALPWGFWCAVHGLRRRPLAGEAIETLFGAAALTALDPLARRGA